MKKILYVLLSGILPYTAVAGKKQIADASEHSGNEEEKPEGHKAKPIARAEKSATKEKPSITFRKKVEQLKQNTITEDSAWEMEKNYFAFSDYIVSRMMETSSLWTKTNSVLSLFSAAEFDETAMKIILQLSEFSQANEWTPKLDKCRYMKRLLNGTLEPDSSPEFKFKTYEGAFTTYQEVDQIIDNHIKVLTEGLEQLNQIFKDEENILAAQLNALSIEKKEEIISALSGLEGMLEKLTIEEKPLIKKSQFPKKDHQ
jgi:hypothetical protein